MQRNNHSKSQIGEVAFIIAIVAIGLAFVLPFSVKKSFPLTGTDSIVILPGTSSGSVTETFSKAFSITPIGIVDSEGGISTQDVETQVIFLAQNGTTTNGVSVITLTTTLGVLFTHNVKSSLLSLTAIPSFVQMQADVISVAGTGRNVWIQGFDCNADGLGTSAWEDLGISVHSPSIAVGFGAGYDTGVRVAINSTLITDVQSCAGQLLQLRVVGLTTSGSGINKFAKIELSLWFSLPPVVLTVTSVTTTQMIIFAIGLPGTYPIRWVAFPQS